MHHLRIRANLASTTTYPKLNPSTGLVWELWSFGYFTTYFLETKLLHKTMQVSLEIEVHSSRIPKNFSLHFSEFSVIFYDFSKFRVKSAKRIDSTFTGNPRTFETITTGSLEFALRPSERG